MELDPTTELRDDVVLLRALRPDDASAVAEACADEEISKWTSVPHPYSLADAEKFLTYATGVWSTGAAAPFAIVDVQDGELLGSIEAKRTGPVSIEIGYWVAAPARGRGVARRALRLLTDWTSDTLGAHVVTLQIAPGNVGSRRAAEAAGYERAGSVAFNLADEDIEVDLYRLLLGPDTAADPDSDPGTDADLNSAAGPNAASGPSG